MIINSYARNCLINLAALVDRLSRFLKGAQRGNSITVPDLISSPHKKGDPKVEFEASTDRGRSERMWAIIQSVTLNRLKCRY